MIGILGGMGTQAGLDFCNKLAILNRGKIDQEYPLFLLYNILDHLILNHQIYMFLYLFLMLPGASLAKIPHLGRPPVRYCWYLLHF